MAELREAMFSEFIFINVYNQVLTLHVFVLVCIIDEPQKRLGAVAAADTLFAGQSLTANQTIVSKGGDFELGFFTPGKSLKHYLGIWYTEAYAQNRTVIWVANRDQPIIDLSSSELKLLENGNLVILNESKVSIWSTNSTSTASNSLELVLGDDGNLVLQDRLNPSVVIWQSFDHLTDTWIPGAKLKYDKRTKRALKLISWKNSEDPSPGLFSVELTSDSEVVIMWNGSRQYWTTGIWDGQGFSLVPEMKSRSTFNYSFTSNENESYITYFLYDQNMRARLKVDLTGQVKQFLRLEESKEWNLVLCKPLSLCDVYAYCGPFGCCNNVEDSSCQCLQGFKEKSLKDLNLGDPTGGCVRKTPLQCWQKDNFLLMPSMKSPANPVPSAVDSAANCKSACLNNCSCNAYAYNSTGCSLWYGDLLNIQQIDNGGDELYIRVGPFEVNSGKKESIHRPVTVGAITGALALLGLVLVAIWIWRNRGSVEIPNAVEGSLVAFTYRDLKTASKNFSEILGTGAFGSVFKGILPNSTLIAVKKLEGISQGEKQFEARLAPLG
ncbi:hypothetical protein Scep_013247 [Stephania cephalantha]|uniref:non-specific serine/threonine protein kinase n=1 Tax=Stephania cephalantha TaxID=152367 RepID=A0AAP0P8B0_9MAGN